MVGLSGCGKEVKVWKEEYSKDKVKEEYQYYHHPEDNRQMKDGWYNSYYENGEYFRTGRYKENEREGKWVLYYESGGVEWEGNYVGGKREGKWVWY